jgi:hypothetical protein
LTTVVAERDLVSCCRLVFYRSPSSSLEPSLLKSFHSSHVHLFLLNPLLCLPPLARASHERWRASLRQARLATPCVYACSLYLQRYKRGLEASVALVHTCPASLLTLRPSAPFVNTLVPCTCLVLPSAAWSRAGARGQRSVQRALVLPFAASSCEHCRAGLWRFGQGQTMCLCPYLQFLLAVGQAEDEGQRAHPRSLSGPSPLPPLLSTLLVNPPPLPHSLFFFFSPPSKPLTTPVLPLRTNTPRPFVPSPPSPSCTSKTPPRTAPSRTSSLSASLRSRQRAGSPPRGASRGRCRD